MYDTDRERLIHLHHCRGIGWKSIARLLDVDPSLASIFHLSSQQLQRLLTIPEKHFAAFFHDLHCHKLKRMIKTYEEQNIHIVTMKDDEYPGWLKHIYDPPWVLYAKGNVQLLKRKKLISVVGTRTPTRQGIAAMHIVFPPLIERGWVIVSGLAKGVDAEAHRLCLRHNGETIAVMAGGLRYIYPPENESLFRQLATTQLVISEYPPFVRPQTWHFPMRNRIISGLSVGTVVVQAKERSGSLITAHFALQQGREVFAIPGDITTKEAHGTNRLIQQGAKLILSSDDIEEEFRHLFT
ncbi:DNA-protecting protein DprA [Anoxybacillus ayderensis]|uniref:DNA-processing protein DprA n=1 Tax=Anoxybacillus TaxID=150247 RepID=UPI00031D5E12|nr:DNA-processing protein DprA [Anoxybacillus sp. ST70]AXM87899.1 DNA-protecting protein DprA [Anoxybacillus ayderensis G10]MBW9217037.1 DNA-processing protein DprA [Anoxybacillus sp. ST70]THD16364.1 DNA-protecting protein DprA [Anoxybacillus ayderensis]